MTRAVRRTKGDFTKRLQMKIAFLSVAVCAVCASCSNSVSRGVLTGRGGEVLAQSAEGRLHPRGTLAANVLGFTGRGGMRGLAGVEFARDAALGRGNAV